MNTSIFSLTVDMISFLADSASKFITLETATFFSEMEKGGIIHAALDVLGKGKGAKGAWKRWIENDLGISKRTGQNYRDVFVNFSAESPDRLGTFSDQYLQEVGISRLVNFLALYKKVTRKNYRGGVKATCSKDRITISYLSEGAEQVTCDLKDFKSVEELKSLIPKNAKRKPKAGNEDLKSIEVQIQSETDPHKLQTLGQEAIKLALSFEAKYIKLQKQLDASAATTTPKVTKKRASKKASADAPSVEAAAMPDPKVFDEAA